MSNKICQECGVNHKDNPEIGRMCRNETKAQLQWYKDVAKAANKTGLR